MTGPPSPEDRQQAIDILTQRFIEDGRDPEESAEVAAEVIDQAIAARSDSGEARQSGLSS